MEKYSFFNDVNGDRVYYAEDLARHLATYFTNGIFNNGCQILANNNDMSVNVGVGSANINGYRYDNDAIKTLMLETADGVLNRIDNIVIRLDLTNRNILTQVIKGVPAENPVAPDLVRTSTIYDIRLAKISIPAGTITITQDLVTDTRFITSDCGNVISTVQTPDTEQLFIQIQAAFEKELKSLQQTHKTFKDGSDKLLKDTSAAFTDQQKSFEQTFNQNIENQNNTFDNNLTLLNTDFETWFNAIKDQINSDMAAKLQNEINTINENMPTKTSQLTNDSGYLTSETDPTVPSHVKSITKTDINNWNGKSNFNGSYTNLTNKPTKLSQFTNDIFVKATSEEEALNLSASNPNKFYYWVES